MKTAWTAGLDKDAAKEVRADFISAHLLRKRLTQMLNDKIETKRAALRKDQSYDKANWPNYVADGLGYERALTEVLSLLESE